MGATTNCDLARSESSCETQRSALASLWLDASIRVLVGLACLSAATPAMSAQVAVREPDESRPGASLAAGGEVRQEYEWFRNEEWGAEVPDNSGYSLQRYMLHVDTRVSRRIRLYGELKSGIEAGRTGGPRASDEDRLDLHQGFVDLSFGRVTVRLGRQELAFGSQRLVSFREGPNVRQSFDGANVVMQLGRWRADGFGTRYVSTETGVFDDSSDTGRSMWGVYAVRSFAQDGTKGVDLYYLGYRRIAATFDQGQGRELRHSLGARFWKTSSVIDHNFEAVIQTGRLAEATIRAWAIGSDTGYRIETIPGRPRLGVRANVTSGDRDRSDDRLGTFNPLFPRGGYFGLIASAGPSNQMDVHPLLTLNPRNELTVTTGWLFFWRHRIDDGIYTTSGSLLRSAEGTRSRFVGHSPGIEAIWRVKRYLSLTGNASMFTAGPFIRESGAARTIRFLAGWATYRF